MEPINERTCFIFKICVLPSSKRQRVIYFAYFNMAEDLVISMQQETVLPRFSETPFFLTLSHDLLPSMKLQMVKKKTTLLIQMTVIFGACEQ